MTTDDDIHARMAAAYAKQAKGNAEPLTQAEIDANRRHDHFQFRAWPDNGRNIRHFMRSRDLNANQALNIIVSQFFQ